MINVLELIDGGFLGGGQRHILSLVKWLDVKKIRPVIAASSSGEFKNTVLESNFKFEDIDLPKFYRLKYLKKLDKIIKENRIDIIHSHGGVAGMYARFYKKKYKNVKVIHTIHGIHYIHSKNFLRRFISLSFEQFLVPYTDRFICVSNADYFMAKKIRIIDYEKTSIIKNGIDTGKFSNVKNKDIVDKLNIKDKDFIIGNVSRFDSQKNQQFILAKVDKLLSKYPELKIVFVGNGKLLNKCKSIAEKSIFKERIIFTGEISNVEDYFSLFDIFIFPSLWEGLSISLIEAMASSRCILASDIDANRELIKNNINGLTFNINDENEFTQKLMQLVEKETLRKRLSEQAFKDSVNYSEKLMTEKIEEDYIKLLY